MTTLIVKGVVVTNPSLNNIGKARFVRVVATAGTVTGEVRSLDSTVLGNFYLHAAGDSVIIEKAPDDKITSATSKVTAVGSPRS
jgi:hypothetical protein|tara:strand:+ start:5624 stop:5875 length:252 start_codon:yes stop_codon:yes gene_type:complete